MAALCVGFYEGKKKKTNLEKYTQLAASGAELERDMGSTRCGQQSSALLECLKNGQSSCSQDVMLYASCASRDIKQ